jgi:hypothetical protein
MLVDADDESVQIMRPNQPSVIVHGDQRIDLDDIVPGFDLTATRLFRAAIPDWLWRREGQAEDEAAASGRSDG